MAVKKKLEFSNATIVPYRNNKPHIVFRQGFWRVSPMGKCFPFPGRNELFYKTHRFVNAKLNKRPVEQFIADYSGFLDKYGVEHDC